MHPAWSLDQDGRCTTARSAWRADRCKGISLVSRTGATRSRLTSPVMTGVGRVTRSSLALRMGAPQPGGHVGPSAAVGTVFANTLPTYCAVNTTPGREPCATKISGRQCVASRDTEDSDGSIRHSHRGMPPDGQASTTVGCGQHQDGRGDTVGMPRGEGRRCIEYEMRRSAPRAGPWHRGRR